jgi:hypothetical protein
MFIHLKKELPVKPMDWIDCPDPQDSPGPELPITNYGINKVAQERLAAIRTDLDSFSDAEARALMISGYRMTGAEINRSLPEFYSPGAATEDWQFMKLDEPLAQKDVPAPLSRLLEAAASLAFKIWKLSRLLRAASIVLVAVLFVLLGWYCLENWNKPLVSIDFGNPGGSLWRLTWSDASKIAGTLLALILTPAFARKILRKFGYRKTTYEITMGAVMSLLGWLAAQMHLLVFDKLYLRWGSQKQLLGSKNKISEE